MLQNCVYKIHMAFKWYTVSSAKNFFICIFVPKMFKAKVYWYKNIYNIAQYLKIRVCAKKYIKSNLKTDSCFFKWKLEKLQVFKENAVNHYKTPGTYGRALLEISWHFR